MATEFYNLPTVNNEKNTFSFVDSVNGLATSIDETMEQMVDGFHAHPYHLPTATKQQLGGVRIGDGWDVYSDGEITPKDSKYILPKATNETLGGIIAGQNIDLSDGDGYPRVSEKAYDTNYFTNAQIKDGSITTEKLNLKTVTEEKAIQSMITTLKQAAVVFDTTVLSFPAALSKSGSTLSNGVCEVVVISFGGNFKAVFLNGISTYRGAPQSGTCQIFEARQDNTTKISDVLPNIGEFNLFMFSVKTTASTTDDFFDKFLKVTINPGENSLQWVQSESTNSSYPDFESRSYASRGNLAPLTPISGAMKLIRTK